MRYAFAAIILSLALFLVGDADAAAKKKNKKGALKGTVVSVQADAGKVTVKTKANKKKMTPGEEVTVSITQDTKFEKVTGKKGNVQRSSASVSDLRQGSKVLVRTSGQQRQAVSIEIKGKKKAA